MVINLSGVENTGAKKWIKEEGHFTLKCVDVREKGVTANGNPVYIIEFKNKNDEHIRDEIVITPNTLWKIKQLSDAFGFTYDNVNILHFKDMYLVGWVKSRKHQNKVGDIVDVFEIKDYQKSAKLQNKIPEENSVPVEYATQTNSNLPEIDVDGEEIPF